MWVQKSVYVNNGRLALFLTTPQAWNEYGATVG